MSCTCQICQRDSVFAERIQQIPVQHRPYFTDIYVALEHAEMDVDYLGCIIDGTWPSADDIIALRRSGVKKDMEGS